MSTTTTLSVAQFVRAVTEYRLLDGEQLVELSGVLARAFTDARLLARHLLHREWLTPFQINQIFLGRAADLLLDQYVLLERLGQGGMGQVFKARGLNLGRVVAVKVIRRERLSNPAIVLRFQREVRAAAQLSHPNIVLALDAGQAAGTWFFVMEYIEGTDFFHFVQDSGPLSVDHACDVIRQTAMGLHHAHERGLLHRDIKPANLMLQKRKVDGRREESPNQSIVDAALPFAPSPFGLVKILDLGLARPQVRDDGTTPLTAANVFVGTPDFAAPEQAADPNAANARADLYSLGCTFYYLLTGRLPFPGGTAMEKILRHCTKEPVPLERLRPDVPAGVAAVVRVLMAKKPGRRFQTAAQVADMLSVLCSGSSPDTAPMLPAVASPAPAFDSSASGLALGFPSRA